MLGKFKVVKLGNDVFAAPSVADLGGVPDADRLVSLRVQPI